MKEGGLQAPGYVRWIVRVLEEAGYESWAVGGAIRNSLLGLPSGDWDLATRAPPPVVQRLFRRTVPVGVQHGTVGVLTREGKLVEVTTFRRDIQTLGRRAVVAFAETIQEDLSRRDFTINAIAWHPLRGEFQDPFQGRRDLEDGLLRTVGNPRDRFREDYLRVLRGMRFCGQYGFRMDPESWEALCEAVPHLPALSPERVREELLKVLSDSRRPSLALSLYAASGALGVLYPELEALRGLPRPGEEGEDLWDHALRLVDHLSPRRPLLRLAALLDGLGVPGEEGAPESRAGERGAALLLRLRFSNAGVREVGELLQVGAEPPLELAAGPPVRRWLHRAGPERLPSLARLWLAKARADRALHDRDPRGVLALLGRVRRELRRRPPLRLEELALDGRDLIGMGMKPGPGFGRLLVRLMDRVLEEPELNDPRRLRGLVAAWMEGGEDSP